MQELEAEEVALVFNKVVIAIVWSYGVVIKEEF